MSNIQAVHTESMERETLTPEDCGAMYDHRSEQQQNRFRLYHARNLADAMIRGTFRRIHPIIIDWNGQVLDGQHTLFASHLSGVALENVWVHRGVNPDHYGNVDIGMRRTAAQFVEGRHGSVLANASRLMMVYENTPTMKNFAALSKSIPLSDIVDYVADHPMMYEYVEAVSLVSKATHIHPGILLAVTLLGSAGAPDKVSPWLDGLNTGAMLEVGDPRLTLRNAFLAGFRQLNPQSGQRRAWTYVVKSWNAFVDGEQLRMLRMNNKGTLPLIESAA